LHIRYFLQAQHSRHNFKVDDNLTIQAPEF
jgi:hypothetical protein